MLRVFFVVTAAILTCHAFPRYQRLRREAESASVESCKNAYDQCPDWKGQGMCSSDQYKDYMMTVCPVTCEFCKESSREATRSSTEKETLSPYADTPQPQSTASAAQPGESTKTEISPQSQNSVISQAESGSTGRYDSKDPGQPSSPVTNSQSTDSASSQSQSIENNAEAETAKEHEEYQQMLKSYYQSVKEQQEAYQKSIAVQYPEYTNSIDPTSSNSDALVAAAPAASTIDTSTAAASSTSLSADNIVPDASASFASPESATTVANSLPEPAFAAASSGTSSAYQPAPPVPSPASASAASTAPASASAATPASAPAPASAPVSASGPAQTSPASSSSSDANAPLPPPTSANNGPMKLPSNVPNPIMEATGGMKPLIIMSPEKLSSPTNTSSALYSKEGASKNKNKKKIESEEDATNETVKSESKHLEKNIKKVKEAVKTVAKKLSQTKVPKAKQVSQLHQEKPKVKEPEDDEDDDEDEKKADKTNSTATEQDSDEEDDTEEDLQAYDSKRTNNKPKIINISSRKLMNNNTKRSKSEGSGSGSSSDLMSEASESGSGSGDEGALESDLKELSFLTSLNFEDGAPGDLSTEYGSVLSHPIENHARDEIEVPEDSNEDNFYEAREVDESPEEQAGDVTSEDSDQSESSGSGSGNAEEESGSGSEELKEEEKAAPAKATAAKNKETKDNESSEKTSSTKATVEESKEENDSEAESGQSEESKEDEETSEEEDAKAVQPAKQAQSKTEGSITLLLRQRFEKAYEDPDSSPYKMLAGNVVTDFKNALKAKVTDISFSEGRVDGNPSQKGKTKVSFNFKGGNDQKIMKKLAKLVDEKQSINGLSVYANSLEFDE